MLEVVVQILENMREVQGKPAIFGERRVNKFRQNKIIFTQVLFTILYSWCIVKKNSRGRGLKKHFDVIFNWFSTSRTFWMSFFG